MKNKIVSAFEDGEHGFVVIKYEPGNSSKYTVVFQQVFHPQSRALGIEWGAVMMIMMNIASRPLLVPSTTDSISIERFMEETGLGERDAVPLLALLNHVLLTDHVAQPPTPSATDGYGAN